MTRRSVAQLAELENAILALSRKVGKGKGDEKLYAAEVLIRRLRKANERDRAGSAIPDGYPRGRGFDGPGGGMRFDVAADRFEGESRIELTSVELAIEQRVFSSKSIKDHHHDLTGQANDELASAVGALDRLASLLARIDNLVDTNPNAANVEQGCTSCARYKDGSGREHFSPASAETGGRRGLCQWCNGWVSDLAANPDGLLPAVELIERRARGQRITTSVIEEVQAAAKRKRAS